MIVVGTRSRARLALALICAILFPDAMRGTEPSAYTLHIASQPLDSALQEFARQTGVQIIFFSYLTDGQRAPALDGTYTVYRAMNALLSDSMLTFRWINAKTIEITQPRRRTDRAN
jgi:outer membrane receptor for ferric coprogen and ferric-rhodotorulic acid